MESCGKALAVVLALQGLAFGSANKAQHPFHRFLQASSNAPAGDVVDYAEQAWNIAEAVLHGSHTEALTSMFEHEGMQDLWTDPDVAHEIVEKAPFLKTLKPLKEISHRRLNNAVTPTDGIEMLGVLTDFIQSIARNLDTIASPRGFAELALKYADSDDEEIRSLMAAVGGEDGGSAMKKLQQLIVNNEIGDVVDLNDFGYDGSAPAPLQQMVKMLNEDEDNPLQLFHGGNEYLKGIVTDPYKAAMDAVEAAGVTLPK